MRREPRLPVTTALWCVLLLVAGAETVTAQTSAAEWPSTDYTAMDARELYQAACAGCHAADGTGLPASTVGFSVPLPDFTECTFATREPDGDWLAIAHEGGPVRGFDPLMPAFGGILGVEELQRTLDHIRTLCTDPSWPRGELNFPRAMVTEKAYPEDEAVVTYGTSLGGPGALTAEFVYETRIGSRSQIEFVVPFTYRERPDGASWHGGVGDLVVGVKRVLAHHFERGSIFSAAAEMKLPTGNHDRGFGSGTPVFEAFLAAGQALPSDGFVHVQGIWERPFDLDRADEEAALRVALGRSFTQGTWGRTWSPIVEVLAARALSSGSEIEWDLVPQFQVTLNTRQHVMANLAVRVPVTHTESRKPSLLVYVLWDWFDGGFFEGW